MDCFLSIRQVPKINRKYKRRFSIVGVISSVAAKGPFPISSVCSEILYQASYRMHADEIGKEKPPPVIR
eukprot:scaffold1206_cov56-Attheya_sp.AAC.2